MCVAVNGRKNRNSCEPLGSASGGGEGDADVMASGPAIICHRRDRVDGSLFFFFIRSFPSVCECVR